MQIRRHLAATTLTLLTAAVLAGCAGAPPAAGTPPKSEPAAASADSAATTEAAAATTEPVAAQEPAAVAATPLEGTTWSGSDSDSSTRTMEFLPGGGFATSENGRRYTGSASTWTQTGDQFTAELEQGSSYTGTITGDTITGSGSNTNGARWTFEVTMQ